MYASTDGVRFSIRRRSFKMATIASFHAENCCHLVSEREASDQCELLICSRLYSYWFGHFWIPT